MQKKVLAIIVTLCVLNISTIPSSHANRNDSQYALKKAEEGANEGDASDQLALCVFYTTEEGNEDQRVKWCRRAAEQGNATAQFFLGDAYATGTGVPQDYAETAKWYRKAAMQGLPQAQLYLGGLYTSGSGVPQNHKQAAHWYEKAARQGSIEGQFRLGLSYAKGEGVLQDYVESYAWLNLAAAQGNANAVKVRDAMTRTLSGAVLVQAQKLSKEYYQKYVEPFREVSQ